MRRLKTSLWIFDIGFRRMNAQLAPGWAAQMLVFGMLGLIMIAAVEFGLPMAWPLTIIGTIDLVATQHFVRGSLRRIRRLGIRGPTRARWWIEVAALDWTLCISGGVFAFTHGNPAAALPAWQQAFVAFALGCAAHLFFPFLALAVVGFLLGFVQGRRIRGRSLELVTWFFWWIVVIVGSCLLVPQHPALTTLVAPALALLSAVVLCAAALVAVKQRILRPSGGRDVKPSDIDRGSDI